MDGGGEFGLRDGLFHQTATAAARRQPAFRFTLGHHKDFASARSVSAFPQLAGSHSHGHGRLLIVARRLEKTQKETDWHGNLGIRPAKWRRQIADRL
jgi:hypothetical protein